MVLTNQAKQSGFDKKTLRIRSGEMHQAMWTNENLISTTLAVMTIKQAQICKENSL